MINAPITPGTHPRQVRRKTISTEPHPRSITASGGKIIANRTCKQDIVYIFFIYFSLYAIPDRDDGIKIVESYFFCLCFTFYSSMLSGVSEFPTYHIQLQFSALKYIAQMLRNGRAPFVKKGCYCFLRCPDGLVLVEDLYALCFVFGLEDQELSCGVTYL